ncbi:hypothetical protein HY357_00465 [Candidatus Roizmanbacteria bacterium]|nr:hypothetical protein [Candidatus Roizmanbacteria bacterium]
MKAISYSAPAKVILSGDHAVVYGKPALVSAIDLRLRFTISNSVNSQNVDHIDKVLASISLTVREYLKREKIRFIDKSYFYKIESEIPIRRGLGSSAALSVAATAVFLEFYSDKQFNKETINNVAYQSERYFHINPSGVDVSASCFGGLIYYRKEFEFLKNISALNFKIPKKIEESLYLIDSGKPVESTAEMVDLVGKAFNKRPEFVEEVFNDIEKTTRRLVVSIIKEDSDFFARSIVDNQILLEMLGVVSSTAKKLLKDLEPYGVGKVTGAGGKKGGSGFIIFYTNKSKQLEEYCKKKKITFMKFKQSYKGVRKEA